MRLLTNDDVKTVLDMKLTVEALRAGYDDLVRGDAAYVPRIDLWAPTGRSDDYYQWGSMAGVCRAYDTAAVRIKSDVVSYPNGTQEKFCVRPGLYCGIILVYNIPNAEPIALIQDGYLQHMRVGGAVAIGTDLLAREDASSLGMLGSGGMARTYLEALMLVRDFDVVRVYSPTKANRERFAATATEELGLDVVAVDSAREAIEDADIIASATDSMKPTFDPAWVKPGAHVNNVTRRELSPELLERCDPIIQLGIHTIPPGTPVPGMEWKTGSMAAYVAGQPEERAWIPSSKTHEVGFYPSLFDVQRGRAAGRTSPDQISLFVNIGTQGLQFASVAGKVARVAEERGIGSPIPVEWFLEDIRD